MRISAATRFEDTRSPVLTDLVQKAIWRTVNHEDWQNQILGLAKTGRWEAHHQRISRQSREGWPVLTLVRPPRLIFSELKKLGDSPTPAQFFWLQHLARCPQVECYVWWPMDWDEAVAVLG